MLRSTKNIIQSLPYFAHKGISNWLCKYIAHSMFNGLVIGNWDKIKKLKIAHPSLSLEWITPPDSSHSVLCFSISLCVPSKEKIQILWNMQEKNSQGWTGTGKLEESPRAQQPEISAVTPNIV